MRISTAFGPIGPASEGLAAAIGRLETRTEKVADDIGAALRQLPEYGAIVDPATWDDIRQNSIASVRLSWAALRDGVLPNERELANVLYFAKRRAEQGVVSMHSLHSAYVTGMRTLWEALIREVGDDEALRAELLDRSSWAFQYLDFITSEVADAYHEVQKGRTRVRDQRTRDLFDEIIDGDPEDIAGLDRCARLVGLEVRADLRMVVVRYAPKKSGEPPIGELPPVPLLLACADSAGVDVEQIIAARRGSELLLIFPWWEGDLRRLHEALGSAMQRLFGDAAGSRAGVSGRARGAGDLRRAYLECVRARELGAVIRPESSVHGYDDYVLDDVFDSTIGQGERLIEQTLGPLLEMGERGERLVETLGAYFRAGFNHKVAAAAVDVHRNTLTHRLEQIRGATGLDLENPAERLRVETALRFLELRRLRAGD